MGDGLLVEFASVVNAVACALDWQAKVAEDQAARESDDALRFRIGINLGDVIVEADDIHGDGVNIAARLEEMAAPGGICLSADVYRQVRGKVEADFEDLGDQTLKNVSEPVGVHRVVRPDPARDPAGRPPPAGAATERPSVAVLPFANMSADPEQDYFSDGLTEDLITELSRFKELSVISRNSAFVFKGAAGSLRAVGEKLNAGYLVEGSVRKAGKRIRVTAQLIDAGSDNHIWAERYDRDLEDIFEVQDDVVRRVASTLVGRLEHERQERSRRQSQSQLKAYDLYLRGREHYFNWTFEDNLKAHDFLKAALDVEPDDAAALALSSEVLLRMWLNGWSEDPDRDLADCYAAAKRADEIDDQDSRVQTALGMVHIWRRDLDGAKHYFETALKLNPNDTRVQIYYSRQAVFDGDTDKAVALCRRAATLNPYGKYNYNLAIACFVARQYRQAIDFAKGIKNPPAPPLALLAASHAMAGETAAAAAACARFLEAAETCPGLSRLGGPEDWRAFFSARWPFRSPDELAHLIEALGKAGVPV
jgi:adenylate cyclase